MEGIHIYIYTCTYIHTHIYIHIYIFHGLRQFSGGWVGGCMYMVSWGFLNRKWVSTCLGYFYIFMWENMDAMDAKDVGMMAGWVPVISRGSQFLRYDGLMGFKLDLSTLIYQVKYHPIPGFQYCWDGNRREGLGSNPPSSELFSESFGQCALASLRLGVSGYRLRFLSDGDVSYETKCWEAGLQRRFPRFSVIYI